MTQDNDNRRRSIRLKEYDYTQAGAYFITVCARNRASIFGEIRNGEMIINRFGEIVANSWLWLFDRYDYLLPDYYVVMPNHFHGILFISDMMGGSRAAPTSAHVKRKPLGQLIGVFKTRSVKQIRSITGLETNIIWQRNYYEHVIRTEDELNRVREYIIENPAKWEFDLENPDAITNPENKKQPWDNEQSG